MMDNRNILCISSTEWHDNYIKPSVELMKTLSVENKVLYVNSLTTFAEVINHLRGKKKIDLKRALGIKSRIEIIEPFAGARIYVLTPPVGLTINFLPPGPIYKFFLSVNAWLMRISVKRALKKLGMNHDLIHLVAFNPGMGLMNGRKYGERSLIYHCYDEIKGCSNWVRKHGVWLEAEFMKMIDGVIVTSKNLYKSKSPLCNNCFIVNNAANYALFSKGFNKDPGPQRVIGYIGTIDDRIDYALLEHLFLNVPDARFVFVGRIMSAQGQKVLEKYPNVVIEGARAPEELPAYLKPFSAGIIPFINDTFTNCIYPMKINEYLAAGLPVISTDFGDMSEFKDVISMVNAGDKEGFLQHTLLETEADSMAKRQRRQQIAQGNTWAKRAEELSAAIRRIEQHLKTPD